MEMILPATRSEARAKKVSRYYTGEPCKYGHLAPRMAVNGTCRECARIKTAARLGAWKLANPQQAKERTAAWAKANPDRHREYEKAYYEKNKFVVIARAKQWREAHPEEAAASAARGLQRNLIGHRAQQAERRSKQRNAPGKFTKEDVEALLSLQGSKCGHCNKRLVHYDVDHIIPLALGGSNDRRNLQILCPKCNRRKGAFHPVEFAQREGRLL